MLNDFVIVGLGQLGQLYGAGALKAGFRVTPVRRGDDPSRQLADLPPGVPVVVAVGEGDLSAALAALPDARHADVILLQNELYPQTWEREGLTSPSITVPWVLKKPGLPVTAARASGVFGRFADEMASVYAALDLPVERLANEADLEQALVSKYVFILAINALGLVRDTTLGEWLEDPGPERDAVLEDALRLGQAKLGHAVDEAAVRRDFLAGMRGLSAFGSRGRTAGARIARAVEEACALGVEVPTLAKVAG